MIPYSVEIYRLNRKSWKGPWWWNYSCLKADRYALGRLNHHPEAERIHHRLAISKAVEVLERHGKPYTIKEGSR
ncbi:MAG: hypothetical protein ACOCWR_10765 [Oceanidesulfovibrio sp.]